jgi:hypothetical protein
MRSTAVIAIAIVAGIAVARGLRSRPELPAAENKPGSPGVAPSLLVKTPQAGGETNPGPEATTRPIRLEKRPREGRVFRLDSLHFDRCKATAKAAWLETLGYETRMITAEGKAIRLQIPTLPCAANEVSLHSNSSRGK